MAQVYMRRPHPGMGTSFQMGGLLLIAALLILKDPFISSWGSDQGHIPLLVCVVPSHAVWDEQHSLEFRALAPGSHLQQMKLVKSLSTKGIEAVVARINIGSSCMQTKQCLRYYFAV